MTEIRKLIATFLRRFSRLKPNDLEISIDDDDIAVVTGGYGQTEPGDDGHNCETPEPTPGMSYEDVREWAGSGPWMVLECANGASICEGFDEAPIIADATSVIVLTDHLEAVQPTLGGSHLLLNDAYSLLEGANTDPVAVAELRANGLDVFPNLMYNYGPLRYHPGIGKATSGGTTIPAGNAIDSRPVFVLDSGDFPSKANAKLGYRAMGVDQLTDTVTGHGPAIAALIGHMTGQPERVTLIGITSPAGLKTPDDHRAFRYSDLLAAMTELTNQVDAAQANGLKPVVNMSFGTKSCEELTTVNGEQRDPLYLWIQARQADPNTPIDSTTEITVTAAAGNSEVSQPTYPAAFPNVIAVGSKPPNGTRTFSDHGPWVNEWRDGQHLKLEGRNGQIAWGGTSFAAPRVAAEEAV